MLETPFGILLLGMPKVLAKGDKHRVVRAREDDEPGGRGPACDSGYNALHRAALPMRHFASSPAPLISSCDHSEAMKQKQGDS